MSREQYAGGLTICRPDDSGLRRRIWRCPTCECRTETVVRYEAWYDPTESTGVRSIVLHLARTIYCTSLH